MRAVSEPLVMLQPAGRIDRWLIGLEDVWLVTLPLLRPLVWSGDARTPANLFLLCLVAAAAATGLLGRALRGPSVHPHLLSVLGIVWN